MQNPGDETSRQREDLVRDAAAEVPHPLHKQAGGLPPDVAGASGTTVGASGTSLTAATLATPEEAAKKSGDGQSYASKSPTQIAVARLRKDKVAMTSAAIIIFFIFMAVTAPLWGAITGQDVETSHPELIDELSMLPTIGFTSDHWLGLEPRLGRDLFVRWVYGAQPSLIIGLVCAAAVTTIGTSLGLLAGFLGGWVDSVIGWIIDFMLSLPFLLFAIATVPIALKWAGGAESLSAVQQSSLRFNILICVLVIFGWASIARLIRGQVISLREQEFVQAAKSLGVPTWRILFRELLPNLAGPIIVAFSMAVPAYISAEAGLSFLGVGLVEPTPSWGLTISSATSSFQQYPTYLLIPVISLSVLVLSLSLLGDAVRDAFDPSTRR